ncbi:SDR family NAD(P)-dependent oxidoreductase [Pelotalea chapellei]|uniref:SDR family oxidoreductase n=1 Tax=Pelotalea chapellei TaxID=44671 RepID=A0ABS5U6B1_9BACT|nr:SDR family oxidoreductase [Pelotalea chapellei]MBT1071193.1 SDR family oxidoreductase [Pelotalea chapellei]
MTDGTRLAGKVAVITGGGRGLGRAAALAFAVQGASVAVVSRTEGELVEVADLIGRARCLPLVGDVALEETARRVVAATVERFGGIHILMNNAAVVGPFRRLGDVSATEWDVALGINLKGAFLLAREAIPYLKRVGGAIINVTSSLGSSVLSPFGMYCIGKAGLNQLTRMLALELEQDGIRVNGLDPGVIDTSMQEQIRAAGPQALGTHTWQRFVDFKQQGALDPATRAAALAVFLAAPPPSVNGEIGNASHFASFGFKG